MLPQPLPPGTSVEEEMKKWKSARDFYNKTGQVDIAYDGIFFKQLAAEFCHTLNLSAPDWIFLDDESYGTGWDTWRVHVVLSNNAQRRRLPGETQEQLAARMVEEVFATWTHCIPEALVNTTNIGWYGTPFPDILLSRHGVSMQPSTYGPIHYLHSYPEWLASFRNRQEDHVISAEGALKPRQLIPWLTACTYGQMDAKATLDGALHSFGRGATGFAFFITSCFDDPGKMLALSTAIAYAVPFEDWLVNADLVRNTNVLLQHPGTFQNVLSWSGMRSADGKIHWMVITPADPSLPSVFQLGVEEVGTHWVCDLTTGESTTVDTTSKTLNLDIHREFDLTLTHPNHREWHQSRQHYSSSYVLLISMSEGVAGSKACKEVALPSNTWLPVW